MMRQNRRFLRSICVARILIWSAFDSAVICGGFKVKYPELDLYWLWKMPFAVAGMFVLIGFQAIILPVLACPIMTVSEKEIRYSHLDTGWVAKRDECASIELVVFSPSLRRVRFRHKGKRRSVGLAESVDQSELRSLLPYPLKIVDSRKRFALFHKGGRRVRASYPVGRARATPHQASLALHILKERPSRGSRARLTRSQRRRRSLLESQRSPSPLAPG